MSSKEIEKFLVVEGKNFELIKTRTYTPFSIYKSGEFILRIGQGDIVSSELGLHKKLLDLNFPVAKIVSEGEKEDEAYWIERSLGDRLLGDMFWDDCKKEGHISEDNFSLFLGVSEKFARAQLATAKEEKSYESFYMGVHINYILEELPHLKEEILEAFEKIRERALPLPAVITHGDFNAYNLFSEGVIDFGNSFDGIAGYDLVSNLYHTYCFPKGYGYGTERRYEFTTKQSDKYLETMDKFYEEAGLPKLSNFLSEFILARYIWSAVRMQKMPELQAWRYKNFEYLLRTYLSGRDLSKIVVNL